MKKILFVFAALMSTSAFAMQFINLNPGQSIVIGNYQVTCAGGVGAYPDTLSRQVDPYAQVNCFQAAQLLNSSQPQNQAFLSAICNGNTLNVRIQGLYSGGQGNFRTQLIPMEFARELAGILNSMYSNSLTSSASIQTDANNWNYAVVNYTFRKF